MTIGRTKEGFPQRYAAASLKPCFMHQVLASLTCFPQRYAAASLKPINLRRLTKYWKGFPQRYAAASLKQARHQCSLVRLRVFRSVMLRPH